MEIRFEDAPHAAPWPQEFRLRAAERDEDWRPILDAVRDAWRDHWGYIESPFEDHFTRWSHRWQQYFAPGLWLLAEADETIAGVCLCEPSVNGDGSYGWVATLAVRRAYRRRGLATALLDQAFVMLHGLGKTRVGLGVDASSLTGATRLYERAGMSIHTRYSQYEKELRPGIDTSTREADD
jgi:ribosomal protein S18 acetylase RimI-like enzyme